MSTPADPEPGARPTLRVIRGDATVEEIAAILAIVAARSRVVAAERSDPEDASIWASPEHAHRGVRARFATNRNGWRTSLWPR